MWTPTSALPRKPPHEKGFAAHFEKYAKPKLLEIEIDHEDFAERFRVHFSAPDLARRLITPHLAEVIVQLSRLRETEEVEFFIGEQIFVLALATERDLFKTANVHDTALTTEDSRQFLEEVHEVLDLIETLVKATAPDDVTSRTGPPHGAVPTS